MKVYGRRGRYCAFTYLPDNSSEASSIPCLPNLYWIITSQSDLRDTITFRTNDWSSAVLPCWQGKAVGEQENVTRLCEHPMSSEVRDPLRYRLLILPQVTMSDVWCRAVENGLMSTMSSWPITGAAKRSGHRCEATISNLTTATTPSTTSARRQHEHQLRQSTRIPHLQCSHDTPPHLLRSVQPPTEPCPRLLLRLAFRPPPPLRRHSAGTWQQ
jgi:hypothetical protein